jgi:hypothetical protein
MAKTSTKLAEDRIQLLPSNMTVAEARELVPRRVYGIIVDEAGRPLTCLFPLGSRTNEWPGDSTLADMRAHWPGLITLPAAQAVDDRRVAMHFADELRKHPNVPAIVLVDEQGQPVDVLERHQLYQAVPELIGRAGDRSKGLSAESFGPPEEPSEPPIDRKVVKRYSHLHLPGQLQLHVPCQLKVAINLEPDEAAKGQKELALRAGDWPLKVEAQLLDVQPDFVVDGPLSQVILVPKDEDSATYTFTLIPQSLGEKTIRVRFRQGTRWLGVAKLTTTVAESQTVQPAAARVDLAPAIVAVGPKPDFLILIEKQGDNAYSVRVCTAQDDDEHPALDFGELTFEGDSPAKYMKTAYDGLNAKTSGKGKTAKAFAEGVEIIGNNLYSALFQSEKFKNFYWQTMYQASGGDSEGHEAMHTTPTVHIVSDEPNIPWELLRPYRQREEGKTIVDSKYFCERFAIARGLSSGLASPDRLAIRKIVVVAPPSNLKWVKPEVEALTQIAKNFGLELEIIESKEALKDFLMNGEAQVLHFACHGKFNRDAAESSFVVLGKDTMAASEITGKWTSFGRFKPLVFLNVCDSAQQGLGLTGLDGWAARFLREAQVGCFIGSIWKTTDNLACQFAEQFYARLLEGSTVGEALRKARDVVRIEGDATYLSYSAWSNPQMDGRESTDAEGDLDV